MEPISLIPDSPEAAESNRTTLQTALDTGPVVIDQGLFWISDTIKVRNNLSGLGPKSILKAKAPADFHHPLFIETDNITVRDLAVDGDGDNAAPGEHIHNIWICKGARNILIDNVFSYNHQGDGIALHSSSPDSLTSFITIRNCHCYDRGRASVSCTGYGASNVLIEGCELEKGAHPIGCNVGQGAAIDFEPTAGALIENVRIIGNYCGGDIQFSGRNDFGTDGGVIANNAVRNGSILVFKGRNFCVTSNTLSGPGGSIYCRDYHLGPPWMCQGIISNNVIASDEGTVGGIVLLNTTTDPSLFGDFIISGNFISKFGARAIRVDGVKRTNIIGNIVIGVDGSTAGISVSASDSIIADNNLKGSRYGIILGALSSGSESISISHNKTDSLTGIQVYVGDGIDGLYIIGNLLQKAQSDGTAIRIDKPGLTNSYGRANLKPSGPIDETFG